MSLTYKVFIFLLNYLFLLCWFFISSSSAFLIWINMIVLVLFIVSMLHYYSCCWISWAWWRKTTIFLASGCDISLKCFSLIFYLGGIIALFLFIFLGRPIEWRFTGSSNIFLLTLNCRIYSSYTSICDHRKGLYDARLLLSSPCFAYTLVFTCFSLSLRVRLEWEKAFLPFYWLQNESSYRGFFCGKIKFVSNLSVNPGFDHFFFSCDL